VLMTPKVRDLIGELRARFEALYDERLVRMALAAANLRSTLRR